MRNNKRSCKYLTSTFMKSCFSSFAKFIYCFSERSRACILAVKDNSLTSVSIIRNSVVCKSLMATRR